MLPPLNKRLLHSNNLSVVNLIDNNRLPLLIENNRLLYSIFDFPYLPIFALQYNFPLNYCLNVEIIIINISGICT